MLTAFFAAPFYGESVTESFIDSLFQHCIFTMFVHIFTQCYRNWISEINDEKYSQARNMGRSNERKFLTLFCLLDLSETIPKPMPIEQYYIRGTHWIWSSLKMERISNRFRSFFKISFLFWIYRRNILPLIMHYTGCRI